MQFKKKEESADVRSVPLGRLQGECGTCSAVGQGTGVSKSLSDNRQSQQDVDLDEADCCLGTLQRHCPAFVEGI